MSTTRPDPDDLLARVRAEDDRSRQGRLKIFFGYAAGVGKTFAMLEAARRAKADGRDVVVGYVEPHGRTETEALLEGLEAIPTRAVEHRGVTLREFDVEAALARRPDILLVDELAHANAPGGRHAKRWQDVEELLADGITVWTTLNVQHVESLNDVVAQVTGVAVRETVPDRIFDRADDLELADLAPDDLLARLRAGKVYRPDQAGRAADHFFQPGNLVALRELSLRRAAQRVHTEVLSARRLRSAEAPWATADRLLVCVGPSPTTGRVIRTARRVAAALDAPWLAVAVERPGSGDPAARERVAAHLRLAERLGAEAVTLSGENVAAAVLDYARSRNVTKVFVGKTHRPRWRRLLAGGVVEDLLDGSGPIDVYVIHGADDEPEVMAPAGPPDRTPWRPYFLAAGAVAAAGLVAAGLARAGLAEANVVMTFLAAVAVVAARLGRGPAVLASVAAVLVFDFFFVPPYLSFAVSDTQYAITFGVMLAIGLLVSTLTARLRSQLEGGRVRERRLAALVHLGKLLGAVSGEAFLVAAAGRQVADLLGGEVVIYLRGDAGGPRLVYGDGSAVAAHPVSGPAAHWVIGHDQPAGAGTDTLPNAPALFLPLTGSQSTVGAIGVRAAGPDGRLSPDQRQLVEACAGQLALALERDRLTLAAVEAETRAEAEKVRNTLLNGVSHDLRTPLAAVAGAADTLLNTPPADDGTRRQLLETVADEAVRLGRLLENVLQMSRLEAGAAAPNRQWHVLEEVIGSALHRTRRELEGRPVGVRIPPDLPLVSVDGVLLEQVFVNLLENAARHTPAGTPVTVTAAVEGSQLAVAVADAGPGLPPGSEARAFDKFYRASPGADAGRGSGLGLAIGRAIAQAHGGTIAARNRPGGGAEFVVRLPLAEDAPRVPGE